MTLNYDNKPAPGTYRARLIPGVARAAAEGTAYVSAEVLPVDFRWPTGRKATFVADYGDVTIVGTEWLEMGKRVEERDRNVTKGGV